MLVFFTALAQPSKVDNIEHLKKIKEKKIVAKKDLVPHYLALDTLVRIHKYEDKDWISRVIEQAKSKKDSIVSHKFTWHYFLFLYDNKQSKEALHFSLDLIDYAKANSFPIGGNFFLLTGSIYAEGGNYVKEIDYYHKALDAYKRDNSKDITYAYRWLGYRYKMIGDLDKALLYQKESLQYINQITDNQDRYLNLTDCKSVIASILSEQEKVEEAQIYYEEALSDASKQSDQNSLLDAVSQYINFLIGQKQFKPIPQLISRGETLVDSLSVDSLKQKLDKDYISSFLIKKSKYGLEVNKLNLLTHPDSLFSETDTEYMKEMFYDYAILYFDKLEQHDQALKYSKLKTDNLQKTVDDQIQSTMNLIYEKQKSAELIQENFELKDRTQKRNSLLIFLSIVTFFLGLFALVFYRNNKKTQQLHLNLEEKNKEIVIQYNELERITYATTHDIKEPANTINSFIKMISSKFKNDMPSDSLMLFNLVEQTSNRMLNSITLLHNYLVIGQSSKLSIVDLNATLRKVLVELDQPINDKNAKITSQQLPTIECFEFEIEQLFQNLISNALKYSKKTIPPKIDVIYSSFDTYHQFEIKDNGIGIKEKLQGRIFELFQRLHNKSEIEGSGIGLASAEKIAQLHKGKIWVQSQPDIGSSFYFTISKNQLKSPHQFH